MFAPISQLVKRISDAGQPSGKGQCNSTLSLGCPASEMRFSGLSTMRTPSDRGSQAPSLTRSA